jgi:hypothetical protein
MVTHSGLKHQLRKFEFFELLENSKNNLTAFTAEGFKCNKFHSGVLHEALAVSQLGTLKLTQCLLEDIGKPRKHVSRWPIAGPSGCILTSGQQSE